MPDIPSIEELELALSEAGVKVTMPLENTFWGDRYGKLDDAFGHSWSVATNIEDLTPEQIIEGAAQTFG